MTHDTAPEAAHAASEYGCEYDDYADALPEGFAVVGIGLIALACVGIVALIAAVV